MIYQHFKLSSNNSTKPPAPTTTIAQRLISSPQRLQPTEQFRAHPAAGGSSQANTPTAVSLTD
jgi:hypothetical protein